jgi:hypothetical protein
MKIHTQILKSGGIKLAFQTKNYDKADKMVRKALEMELVKPKPVNEINPMRESYVIDGPNQTVYCTPFTTLNDTYCSVWVPKDDKPITIGVRSTLPLPGLEEVVKIAYINDKLIPAGLEPIESNRDDIDHSFLRDYS